MVTNGPSNKNFKIISETINMLSSQKVLGIIILFISVIVLTGLLSSRYFLFQNIIENNISKKDIISYRNIKVVDTEKTEKRRRELEKRVDPILTPAQDDYIKTGLSDLLNSIKQIKSLNVPLEAKKDKIRELFDNDIKDSQDIECVNYLTRISNNSFNIVSNESIITIDNILNKGISESDLTNDIDNIIRESISPAFSRNQSLVITMLLKKIIVPNMVIDELATEIARKNAMNSVKPITVSFERGDKIVSAGELVTKVQKDALKKEGYNITELNITGILSLMCLVGICITSLVYYLINFDTKYLTPSYFSLMSILSVSIVLCAVLLPTGVPVYILPFPAIAILLTIFTNQRISLLLSILLVILIGVAFQYKLEAVSVFIIGVMIATFTASKIDYSKRMDLIKTGLDISVAQVLIIISIYFLQNETKDINYNLMMLDTLLGLISGFVSGMIALSVIPLVESTFKIITPFGLAELANHNQPLLKRLQFEAPGTYHHSLMVSNLSEAAAEAVGANPILVRVGSFYHDIGKLKRPLFFIENQSYFGIENPHEKLNPRLSKMVITAHPKDGVELAKEYGLPNIVNQFIIQHHGNSLASYFYNQALKEEGAENITEEQFRYNNPKPTSKEIAILMIADAVESAVRSLKNPTQEEIEKLIDKIIQERLFDGQLSESPLTQKDLKTIAATFNRILRGMQHHRIKYHENVIEELENNTKAKIHLAHSINKIEKDIQESNKKQQTG
jgi:putative nucleotidyltransferase with HDIG domain